MKRARVLVGLFFVVIVAVQGLAQEPNKHPGLHPVRDANGKWGFIDPLGRWRIAPKYVRANEFSDGVAYVFFWDGEKRADGIVDLNGKFTPLETNGYEVAFHDGLARFQTADSHERKFGYMDKSGRVVIQPQFWDSGDFYEGRAWFEVLKNQEWLYGFIDKTGRVVVPAQFTQKPGDFTEGLARVQGKQALGFIDTSGKFVIPEKFRQLDLSFSEGLVAAFVESERPRGAYLDRSGKVVMEIPLWQQRTKRQLDLFGVRWSLDVPFSEGLAPVMSFNKFGFINKSGQVVIEPLFRGVQGFSEGLAGVKIVGSDGDYVWGFIDRAGNFAIDPQFREVQPFAGGLARVVTLDDKQRLIDSGGKVIWEVK
jgi:hypothetical protein